MRSALLTLALLLQLVSPAVAPGAEASPPASSSSSPARAGGSYQDLTKGNSCRRERTDSYGNLIYKCANVTWRRANIVMNGPISVRLINKTSSPQTLTCRWDESKTWTFSASLSSEIEAGVIFARAKVAISASVSRAKSVSIGTTVDVTVKPRSTGWCKSGMAKPKFGGKVRGLKCGWTGFCSWFSSRDYQATVPKQFVWEVVERKLG